MTNRPPGTTPFAGRWARRFSERVTQRKL
jgi:hypothetical protein